MRPAMQSETFGLDKNRYSIIMIESCLCEINVI